MNHHVFYIVFVIVAAAANLALARINFREARRLMRSNRELRLNRETAIAMVEGARTLARHEFERLEAKQRAFAVERDTLVAIIEKGRQHFGGRS